jgi:Ca2+-binding RTX toxin-like protein
MAIRTVGPTSAYPNIAAAMAAANAGDTIELETGYRNETATVAHNGMIVTGDASSTGIILHLAPGIATFTLAGSAPINVVDASGGNGIVGNDGSNVITVTDGADAVDGGSGVDRLVVDYRLAAGAVTGDSTSGFADAGSSRLVTITNGTFEHFTVLTGAGADTITTGGGDDIINTGEGAGTITAGQGSNSITGGSGADTITALDGGNFIDGGDGTNTITSGEGNDVVLSGLGADTIVVGGGNDIVTVRGGADTAANGAGDDRLIVDYSALTTAVTGGVTGGTLSIGYDGGFADVSGNSIDFTDTENFTITTGSGNDVIAAGDGIDILDSAGGTDTLSGGGGNDRFVYSPTYGADTITDFVAGTASGDKVDLRGFANLNSFSDLLALSTQNGDDTVINFGDGDTLTLQGVSKGTLQSSDFLLGWFDDPSFALSGLGASAGGGNWSSYDQYPRELADVNGDGRADIVAFGDIGVYVALGNIDGSFQPTTFALSGFGAAPGGGNWISADKYPREAADVNGDGRADVVAFGDTGVYVALGNTDGSFQPGVFALSEFGALPEGGSWTSADKYPRELADVNGDGRADVVAFGDSGVYVALGNTDGSFEASTFALASFGAAPAGGSWTSADEYPRELGDVNDDGRADIMAFGNAGVYVALGNSDGSFQTPTFELPSFGSAPSGGAWNSANTYPRQIADVNGDGSADIVAFGDVGVYVALAHDFDFA